MKLLSWIAGIGAVFTLVNLTRLGDAANNLISDIIGADWVGLQGGKAVVKVNYQISNPGSAEIKVDSIQADVYFGKSKVGMIREEEFAELRKSNPEAFVIPAGTTKVLPLMVKIPIGSAGSSLAMQLLTGNIPRQIRIFGFIRANGLRTELNKDIELKV